MLNVTNDPGPDGAIRLTVSGELTIETVAELREALLLLLESGTPLLLDLDGVASIDFFGLQLLCSAHRTSVAKKTLLTWAGSNPALIAETARTIGFSRHCGCRLCPKDITCMWVSAGHNN